jgi:hypothetical protein
MSSRRHIFRLAFLAAMLSGLTCSGLQAQQATNGDNPFAYSHAHNLLATTALDAPPLLRPSPALIIRSFIAAETSFRDRLIHFSFKRDVVLQTISPQGEITGEYLRDSVFVLGDGGERLERVLYHPKSTIRELTITKEDIQDLAGSQLFGLDMVEANAYNFAYLGEESLGGRPTYLLEVGPKQEPSPHSMRARFFVGKIWIDQRSYQIVKLRGVTEPHGKQRFPLFETIRNLNVENLSFPSSTSADDLLRFPHKAVRYRVRVKYYDFKRFAGRVKIDELD